jgi:hypothetical protein
MSENEREESHQGEDQGAQPFKQVAVPLDWYIPDSIKNVYSDQLMVQARARDFILSFFDTQIPPFSGTIEQNQAFIESVKSVRAECVGRIIVAPDMIPDIIQALQTAYDRHLSTKGETDV